MWMSLDVTQDQNFPMSLPLPDFFFAIFDMFWHLFQMYYCTSTT